MKGLTLIAGICFLVFSASVAKATIATLNPVDEGAEFGFEIGSGWTVVQNIAGKYGINVPDSWASIFYDKFTEIAPTLKGEPRSSLQINVIDAHGVRSARELIETKVEGNWSIIDLGGLDGIKDEVKDKNGYRSVALELIKGDELVLINLEGQLEQSAKAPFNQLYKSLKTINIE